MPKETIMSKISDEEFEKIVKSSSSLKEIAYRCGYSNNSGASCAIIKDRIAEQQLNFSTKHQARIIREDADIFVEDSPVEQSTLRRRYYVGRYSEYKCAICNLEPFWNGQELVLTLDHINGHNRDDRLENLRWICPNCDRQLSTFAGRNIVRTENKNFCIDCGKEILQSSTRCVECANKEKSKKQQIVERPTRIELKSLIRSKSFLEIGRKYGVTDNAIRKWCDAYNLPRTKKEIQKFNDIDWEGL